MLRRLTGLGLTAVLLALALVAVGSTSSTQAVPSARGGAVMRGAPRPGQCFNMTRKVSNKKSLVSRAVPCSQPHTVWITRVVTVKDFKDKTRADATYRFCVPALGKTIGKLDKRYGLSLHGLLRFDPTKELQRKGARWFACGVTIYGKGRTLQTSRAKHPYRLTASPSPSRRVCLDRDYYYTPCSAPHAFEPTKVVDGSVPEDPQESAGYDCPHPLDAYSSKSYGTKTLDYGDGEYPSNKVWVTCYRKS